MRSPGVAEGPDSDETDATRRAPRRAAGTRAHALPGERRATPGPDLHTSAVPSAPEPAAWSRRCRRRLPAWPPAATPRWVLCLHSGQDSETPRGDEPTARPPGTPGPGAAA